MLKATIPAILSRRKSALPVAGSLSRLSHRLRRPQSRTVVTHSEAASLPDDDITMAFSQPSTSRIHGLLSASRAGLFNQPELASPASFKELAARTVTRAKLLVRRLHHALESQSEKEKVVKNFDRLSDMLCGVIDSAELLRHSHPDREWVDAADEVYDGLCSYMNVLNTDVELYHVLKAILKDADVSTKLTYEQRQTSMIFIRDFEKSGIHLPPVERAKFVSLSDDVNVLGRTFSTPSRRGSTDVRQTDMDGIPAWVRKRLAPSTRFSGRLKVGAGSWEASLLSSYAPNEDLRRRLYTLEVQPEAAKLEALDGLLRARDQLSRLVGRKNYAEWSLEDKMAKTPNNVMTFLRSVESHERPLANDEVAIIANLKQSLQQLPTTPVVQAWDREFYSARRSENLGSRTEMIIPAGTAFQGISRLFNRLYGLRLQPREVLAGEVWHQDVQRLDVIDEANVTIGILYVDLWARRGKHSGAAHYTVRCSRRIDDDDADHDFMHAETGKSLWDGHIADIMRPSSVLRTTDGKISQLPVAALVCEFVPSSRPMHTGGLTWHEMKTLFHEMGHAIHSMIGRTDYHNVSGTRCSTDFVELPSILMERFLVSPAMLSLFPSSPGTTMPTHSQLMRHLRATNAFPAIEAHTQILMATLDQTYHSNLPSDSSFSSTTELHKLQDSFGLFPSVPGTAWQTQFTHLYGYGATYYTYLFCRAIAAKVWNTLFEADPLDRAAGERFKREVLRYGGGKDPWEMLAALLDMPELAAGDKQAMDVVGRWGVEE